MLFQKIWQFFHFFLVTTCHRNHSFTLNSSEFKFLELVQTATLAFHTISISIMFFLHHLIWFLRGSAPSFTNILGLGDDVTWDLKGGYFALVHIQHKRTISLWFHYYDKRIQMLHGWTVPLKKQSVALNTNTLNTLFNLLRLSAIIGSSIKINFSSCKIK